MTTNASAGLLLEPGGRPGTENPTHLEQTMNHTDPIGDPTAESARALLYRHGLPEDVIDGALCLHAQELAALQRLRMDELDLAGQKARFVGRIVDLIDPTRTPAVARMSVAEAEAALAPLEAAVRAGREAQPTETDEQRADREETERDHARGDHTYCGITCEVELPTEHLRNFVIAKGYPGTKGALDELLRRAAASAVPAAAETGGRAALRDRIATAVDEGFRLYSELEDISLGASITDSVLTAVLTSVLSEPTDQAAETPLEKRLRFSERRNDELRTECKRRGKRVLEQSEQILALERQLDEVRRQLGEEILRAGQAEAEAERLRADHAAVRAAALHEAADRLGALANRTTERGAGVLWTAEWLRRLTDDEPDDTLHACPGRWGGPSCTCFDDESAGPAAPAKEVQPAPPDPTVWQGATELAPDHEITALAATGLVGYRQRRGTLLHCLAHKPAPASRWADFHEVTADDLDGGGICVHPRCGRDLLAPWPPAPAKEA